jgi:hypothetical protein
VLARLGRVDAITLLDEGRDVAHDGVHGAGLSIGRRSAATGSRAARRARQRQCAHRRAARAPPARWSSRFTPRRRAGVAAQRCAPSAGDAAARWIAPAVDTASRLAPRRDAFGTIEQTFFAIADLAGVPGHSGACAIRSGHDCRPGGDPRDDGHGRELIVAVGPDRDSVAFIAHMDEVSFEVEGILPDGRVRLARRGGVVMTAWEGQPAMLHFDRDARGNVAASLRGVFVPRDSARSKPVNALTAWFGTDSAGLVARGVTIGSAITAYKHAARLGGTRLTARGSDDRTGSTALLHALARIDPATLAHKGALRVEHAGRRRPAGASAFGANHGRNLQRVYSIDTFVSSDTPLESPMFAFAPLGEQAVLRGSTTVR